MYKVNVGSNYPDKYGAQDIIKAIGRNATVVTSPHETEFFIFPIYYEVLFEYSEAEYTLYSFSKNEIEDLKVQFKKMVDDAATYKKKLIIFYYRDPIKKIHIPNTIVFRTSVLKSKREYEYALPAFGQDIRKLREIAQDDFLIKKSEYPMVGFRGQSAPVDLPVKLTVKRMINDIFDAAGIDKKINLYFNFGYLARRDAIVACLKNKKIISDITLTTQQQSFDGATAKELFLNNLLDNQYNICASGHGNYSFRLYETLSAGRIPVFINTDCVLPFEEFIEWKKHVVWIEEKEAHKADKIILEFHNSIHPDDFLQLQQNNRLLWEQYMSYNGFFENLYRYFSIINK